MNTLNLSEYIRHPERLDNDSLDGLRRLVEAYPYHQAARLLYLQNLYRLHHADFDRELRRAALFVPDRRALYLMVEAQRNALQSQNKRRPLHAREMDEEDTADRTQSLIDTFLQTRPEEAPRKVRPADAATDYMAYLLQSEGADGPAETDIPRMQHQDLIDEYIGQGDRRIVLSSAGDNGPTVSESSVAVPSDTEVNEDYFTETLAKIYIQQGRYEKAAEIMRRLSAKYPSKSRYMADQIRFLDKLILNSKNKK